MREEHRQPVHSHVVNDKWCEVCLNDQHAYRQPVTRWRSAIRKFADSSCDWLNILQRAVSAKREVAWENLPSTAESSIAEQTSWWRRHQVNLEWLRWVWWGKNNIKEKKRHSRCFRMDLKARAGVLYWFPQVANVNYPDNRICRISVARSLQLLIGLQLLSPRFIRVTRETRIIIYTAGAHLLVLASFADSTFPRCALIFRNPSGYANIKNLYFLI